MYLFQVIYLRDLKGYKKKEFIHFLLLFQKGSCSELITQLHICKNLNLITKDEFMLFESQSDKILRKLGSFIKYLKLA